MANRAEYEDKMGRLLEVAKNDPDEARRQQATDYLRQLRSEYAALPVDEEVSTEQPAGEPISYGDLLVSNVKETAKGVARSALGVGDLVTSLINAGIDVADEATRYLPLGVLYEQVTGEEADVIPDELRLMPITEMISGLTGTDVRGALAADTSIQVPGAPDPSFMGTVSEYMAPGIAIPAAAQKIAQSANTVRGSQLATKQGGMTAPLQSRRPDQFGTTLAGDVGDLTARGAAAYMPSSFVAREAALAAPAALAGATAREMGASPLGEAAASLGVGALTGVAAGATQAGMQRAKAVDSTVNKAAERQIGETMLKTVDNVDDLVQVANRNRQQLIDAGVIERDDVINTFTMTENPALVAMVNKISQSSTSMQNSLADMSTYLDKQLTSGLEELTPKGTRGVEGGQRITQAVSDRISGAQERFTSFAESTNKELNKLRSQYTDGELPSDISISFSNSMKEAFDTAKATEKQLWRNVDDLELDVNPKNLRKAVNGWFRSMKAKPYFSGSIPTEVKEPIFKFSANPTSQNYRILMSELRSAKAKAYNDGDFGKANLYDKVFNLVDDQVSRLNDNPAYQEAVAFTRNVYKTFDPKKLGKFIDTTNQGNLQLDPEDALSKMIKPGASVGEVRRLVELDNSGMGGEAVGKARKSVEDYFYQMYGGSENKQKFLSQYRDLLNKFPTMGLNLQKHADELDRLAEGIANAEGRAANLSDKNKVAVSVFLGADPNNLGAVINKINSKDLPKMMKFFERSGLAEEFQGIYIDRLTRKIINADRVNKFNLGDVLRDDATIRAGWDNVLTKKQKEYITMLERFGTMGDKPTGYSEAINKQLRELMTGDARSVMLARATAVRLSSVAVPSGPGSIQTAAIAANFAKRAVNGLKEQQVTQILDRMLKDPEYFEEVLRMVNKEKTLPEKLDVWYGALGIRQVPSQRAEDERQRRRGNPMGRPTPPPQPQPGMLTGM